MFQRRLLLYSLLLVLTARCGNESSVRVEQSENDEGYNYPAYLGEALIPNDSINKHSQAAIDLGRHLFYDVALSRDSSISCASCHHQSRAFSDPVSLSKGVNGKIGNRNALPLFNLVYYPLLFWDGSVSSLEKQVQIPIHDTMEMNFSLVEAVERFEKNSKYQELAQKAYNRSVDMYVITRAIAAFERTIISSNSRYDVYIQGDTSALTAEEKLGKSLFNSKRLKCAECHTPPLFTNLEFRNNGAFQSYLDSGRVGFTMRPEDKNLFRVPTLRNIALTGPYMHDGSYETISEIIESYKNGGYSSPERDSLIAGFEVSLHEEMALVAFLKSLTDSTLITNDDYSDPHK